MRRFPPFVDAARRSRISGATRGYGRFRGRLKWTRTAHTGPTRGWYHMGVPIFQSSSWSCEPNEGDLYAQPSSLGIRSTFNGDGITTDTVISYKTPRFKRKQRWAGLSRIRTACQEGTPVAHGLRHASRAHRVIRRGSARKGKPFLVGSSAFDMNTL